MFKFPLTDTMRLVPMHFRYRCVAVVKFHRGDTLESFSIYQYQLLSETHNIVNVATNGDNFCFLYSPYDLEIHQLFS